MELNWLTKWLWGLRTGANEIVIKCLVLALKLLIAEFEGALTAQPGKVFTTCDGKVFTMCAIYCNGTR